MNIIDLAHRICWRYKHSNDPHHSSTYTFNDRTLMQFAEAIRAEYKALLKLAEEALAGGLWDYGPGQDEHTKCEEVLAAVREALAPVVSSGDSESSSGGMANHSGDANKMVGCAYCDNPLFAGTKCNNCGQVTLAEPVKQEPIKTGGHVGWHLIKDDCNEK